MSVSEHECLRCFPGLQRLTKSCFEWAVDITQLTRKLLNTRRSSGWICQRGGGLAVSLKEIAAVKCPTNVVGITQVLINETNKPKVCSV